MTPPNRLPIAEIAERLRSLAEEWAGTDANERASFLMGEVTVDGAGRYAAARKVA